MANKQILLQALAKARATWTVIKKAGGSAARLARIETLGKGINIALDSAVLSPYEIQWVTDALIEISEIETEHHHSVRMEREERELDFKLFGRAA